MAAINILLSNLTTKGLVMTGLAYPEISPIIFSIGPLAVRWYSMAYLAGILVGWGLVLRRCEKYQLNLTRQNIEDLVFYITLGIIVGGRLGYVIFYGGKPMWEQPWQILELWKGGMSFHGGAAGVILAIWLYARKIGYPFLMLTDLVVPVVPIGLFLGRLANFTNDELWGRVSDVAWAVRFPSGGFLPRHPSQLYEAFFEGIVMFIVLNWLWHFKSVRSRTGVVSAMFVILYGIFRISLEQFREPDAQLGFFFGHITMGQMLSVPLILAGLVVLGLQFKSRKL